MTAWIHTTEFTVPEIEVRHKVYTASQRGYGVVLSSDEAAALWSGIFKTGRELCRLRDEVDFKEACE